MSNILIRYKFEALFLHDGKKCNKKIKKMRQYKTYTLLTSLRILKYTCQLVRRITANSVILLLYV